jgi:uncharacterized membrane protein
MNEIKMLTIKQAAELKLLMNLGVFIALLLKIDVTISGNVIKTPISAKNTTRRAFKYMEININDTNRTAEFWLSNTDRRNPLTQIALDSLCDEYKAKKYTVAVFRSGNVSLKENTAHLLHNNRLL